MKHFQPTSIAILLSACIQNTHAITYGINDLESHFDQPKELNAPPSVTAAKKSDDDIEDAAMGIDPAAGNERGQIVSAAEQEVVYDPNQAQALSWHVGTTTKYSGSGALTIDTPRDSNGDNVGLFLFLSRTDSYLPIDVGGGWQRVTGCYKTSNQQSRCLTPSDCVKTEDDGPYTYCHDFGDGKDASGEDLGTVVFFREGRGSDSSYSFEFVGNEPSWAVMTAIVGVDTNNPIRDSSGTGCDKDKRSVFPSVSGSGGDVLLLYMANDDPEPLSKFGPPAGTQVLGYVSGSDEAGFLYGAVQGSGGSTGSMATSGSGSYECRDEMISLGVRMR